MADELLTIDEVAEALRLHPDTVRRYIRERKLKAVRIAPTAVRVKRSELDRFINTRETDLLEDDEE